jgi:cytoskeletal protein CcmA (bactofilin family)
VLGAEMEGHLEMGSSLRLDGKLVGSLNCKGRLVLGKTGQIEGNVACKNADIEGEINGDLVVGGTLFLRSSSKINGNIKTQKIVVEDGAVFNGQCQMSAKVEPVVAKLAPIESTEEESQIVY